MAVKTTWLVIAIGRSASAAKGAKSLAPSVARSASTTGSAMMAVGGGAAVAGHVLDHRQDAAGEQARRPTARPRRRDQRRVAAEGAVADRLARAGDDDVEDRQAIDRDAEIGKVGGDQPRLQPGGARRPAPVAFGDGAEHVPRGG